MPIVLALIVFVLGTVGIFTFVYRVLIRRFTGQIFRFRNYILCRWCPQLIHSCKHTLGVPSGYDHEDGLHYCRNTFDGEVHWAEHR